VLTIFLLNKYRNLLLIFLFFKILNLYIYLLVILDMDFLIDLDLQTSGDFIYLEDLSAHSFGSAHRGRGECVLYVSITSIPCD
jgi:hypothetical protein